MVFVWSHRSAHSNAYLYGFWWNKVIVLFDTLLEPGLLEKEVEGKEKEVEEKEKAVESMGEGEGEGEDGKKVIIWSPITCNP